jgi:hypothetical protein
MRGVSSVCLFSSGNYPKVNPIGVNIRCRLTQEAPAKGRAKLRLSRGFPRRTRLRGQPLKSFVRVEHEMRGHLRIGRPEMCDARIQDLVRSR